MKITNLIITFVFLAISLPAWCQQTDYLSIVQQYYPQIYTTIQETVGKQWDDAQVRRTVMEGQAKAFIEIAESQVPMNETLLAEAIINNSLPGMKEYNTRVLDDLSIENPYPILKCDWFKVKGYYDRRVGTSEQYAVATPTRPYDRPASQTPTVPKNQEIYDDEEEEVLDYDGRTQQQQYDSNNEYDTRRNNSTIVTQPPARTQDRDTRYADRNDRQNNYDDERSSYFEDGYDQYDDNYSYPKKRKTRTGPSPFKVGIKAGVGFNSMYNLGSYLSRSSELGYTGGTKEGSQLQVKSSPGLVFEGGLAAMYKTGGFFVQNETTFQYLTASYKNAFFNSEGASLGSERSYDNTHMYIQTAFHLGGYYEIDKGVSLIAGVGPYVGFKINSSYDELGIYEKSYTVPVTSEGENGSETKQVYPYENYMKDGEKSINFGVSGIFGVDWDRFRIALYPSIGLTELHKTEKHKPFGLQLGVTVWLF